MDLALNNRQRLIYHKTQTNKLVDIIQSNLINLCLIFYFESFEYVFNRSFLFYLLAAINYRNRRSFNIPTFFFLSLIKAFPRFHSSLFSYLTVDPLIHFYNCQFICPSKPNTLAERIVLIASVYKSENVGSTQHSDLQIQAAPGNCEWNKLFSVPFKKYAVFQWFYFISLDSCRFSSFHLCTLQNFLNRYIFISLFT